MPKKVAIVVCAWPPQGGGIGNNAYYHLRELKKIGYPVRAFTPGYPDPKKAKDSGVEFLSVILPLGKAGFLFSLFNRLKAFDIIHFYYPFFGTDLIVWLFKTFNKNKKLIVHYEMDPIGQGWQKIIFLFYLKLFLPLLLKASDKIAVLSWDNAQNSHLKNYLKKYQEKFVELPNGVDTSIFQPQAKNNQLITKYGLLESDQLIIFVGGLDDQHFFKGVDILLEAFTEVIKVRPTIKLMIIGDLKKLPSDLQTLINESIKETKNNKKMTVIFAINYGGRDEMIRAINKINNSEFRIQNLNTENFSEFLDTKNIPDPDLVIRTGGEKRLSGFLPWQSIYSELFFSDLFFPDFDGKELEKAVNDYSLRQRRFGK